MNVWLDASAAAAAMFATDILSVFLTQANARNRASMSGLIDTIGYPIGLLCTTIGVTALQGSDWIPKLIVIAFVSVANYFGQLVGVKLGKRYIRTTKP